MWNRVVYGIDFYDWRSKNGCQGHENWRKEEEDESAIMEEERVMIAALGERKIQVFDDNFCSNSINKCKETCFFGDSYWLDNYAIYSLQG